MNTDARKAYLTAQAAASNTVLNITESLGCIEFYRDLPVNWGDVGVMNSIAEKLKEILQEVENYERVVADGGTARVNDRRERRENFNTNRKESK